MKLEVVNDIKLLAQIASEIWHEYWPCLLSVEQIDYMVQKFQSEEAIEEQRVAEEEEMQKQMEMYGNTPIVPNTTGSKLPKVTTNSNNKTSTNKANNNNKKDEKKDQKAKSNTNS